MPVKYFQISGDRKIFMKSGQNFTGKSVAQVSVPSYHFLTDGCSILVIGSARFFFLAEAFHPANTSSKLETGSHPVIKPLSCTATKVLFVYMVSCARQ
jgi:hypothetical protein